MVSISFTCRLVICLAIFTPLHLLAEDEETLVEDIEPICFYDSGGNLMRDLMIVDWINQKMNDRLPVTFNHFLQGGYLNMPSARMAREGDLGVGYSSVPPYRNVSLRFQVTPDIEFTGSYRIFHNIPDPILSKHGFGDSSDRGVNVKLAILHPEDSNYLLPGVAIGLDDFLGTRNFKSRYAVLTKVWPDLDLEFSLGYGEWRINGVFGGLLWMPWRQSDLKYLKTLALVGEYDAIDYKNPDRELHPNGRDVSSRINLGAKYRLWDFIDLSASWIRGKTFACSASVFYNIGETDGLLPKIHDPLPYKAPLNTQPISDLRPGDVLAQDLLYALRHHGFELLRAVLTHDDCGEQTLRLVVYNLNYYWEFAIREQLQALLSRLMPSNVDRVIVEICEQGCSIQEYHFRGDLLAMYRNKEICDYELSLLSPMREVSSEDGWGCVKEVLFTRYRDWLCPSLLPKTQFLFGSSRGKFKCALGLSAGIDGTLPIGLYYRVTGGYLFYSSIPPNTKRDVLNPSQLPEVQTQLLCYLREFKFTLDEAFLQSNYNWGCGVFSRFSGGVFGPMYGGGDVELLWYPVNSCWAIGIDGAYLRQRRQTGWGFLSRIRKLDGEIPTYIKFPLYQYFLDLYYTFDPARLDFKISSGRFLAGDYGSRFEISRYYPSGLRVTAWYTLTNAHDKVNGRIYHDTGVGFTMPLEIFCTCSSRKEWGNAISAWLRDCGYRTEAGDRLYPMIRTDRR